MVSQQLLSGKIYPDGSFSLGYVPSKTVKKAEKQYEQALREQEEPNYGAVADFLTSVTSIEGKFQSISESPLLVKGLKSSQKSRGVYGTHGITGFGKRICRNTSILLQRKYGKKRLGFGTCTLPQLSRDNLECLLRNWADVTRRFYQSLKRICEKRGSQFIYVGCVEIQEKRFADTRLAVPHLHFVYVSRSSISSRYHFSTVEAYRAWNRAVNQVLSANKLAPIMGVDGHIGSVKLEPIKKAAAAYLGKYLSKGCKVVEAMKNEGYQHFPKQWWTASMQAKKMFKESIIRIDAMFASALFYQLECFLDDGSVIWARFVEVLIGGEYRKVGLSGQFSREAYQLLSS